MLTTFRWLLVILTPLLVLFAALLLSSAVESWFCLHYNREGWSCELWAPGWSAQKVSRIEVIIFAATPAATVLAASLMAPAHKSIAAVAAFLSYSIVSYLVITQSASLGWLGFAAYAAGLGTLLAFWAARRVFASSATGDASRR